MLVVLIDAMLITLAYPVAFAISRSSIALSPALLFACYAAASLGCLLIMARFRAYASLWRFASTSDFFNTMLASMVCTAYVFLINAVLTSADLVPLQDWRLFAVFCLFLGFSTALVRLAYRLASDYLRVASMAERHARLGSVFVGTSADAASAQQFLQHKASIVPALRLIVTTEPRLDGRYMAGLRIFGGLSRLTEALTAVSRADITIGHALVGVSGFSDPQERLATVRTLRAAGIEVREFNVDPVRGATMNRDEVSIEDLSRFMDRPEFDVPTHVVDAAVRNRRVLVTGAAGSIGSGLVHHCLASGAAHVSSLDRSEFGVFRFLMAIGRDDRHRVRPMILDITDEAMMSRRMRECRAEVVFHTAALKHVDLVEQNWDSALQTNIVGTWLAARSSSDEGVSHFVFISTDKAADPVTLLGLTKRAGEILVASLDADRSGSRTHFCAVRFGNVFASDGSVISVFEKQIALRGPVTLTDRRMKRFFMSKDEAAATVLAAAGIETVRTDAPACVYVPDMGPMIAIKDIADTMIRLAGLEPERDIAIVEIGARTGEKLEESLYGQDEVVDRVNGLNMLKVTIPVHSIEACRAFVSSIQRIIAGGTKADAVACLEDFIRTARLPGELPLRPEIGSAELTPVTRH